MKRFYRVIWIVLNLVLTFFSDGFGQPTGWVWAKSGTGSNFKESLGMSTDYDGNIYVTGYFHDTISFGNTTLINSDTLFSSSDIFIVKYDSSGNIRWAQNPTGKGRDLGYGIDVDTNGNIYVSGSFQSDTIKFGNIVLTNSNPGDHCSFIVKYDSSGAALWAKTEDSQYSIGYGLTIDEDNNSYVTGYFCTSTITFDNITLTNTNGGCDLFVVKRNPSGTVIWAKNSFGNDGDSGYGITTDSDGNVYITGVFSSDSIAFGNWILNHAGTYSDFFIVKYDSTGNVKWAKNYGNNGIDVGMSVSTDINNNVYVSGSFMSDSIIIGNNILINANPLFYNCFLAKYDSSGNVSWAKSAASSGNDVIYGSCSDRNGNTFVTGSFSNDSITFGNILLINPSVNQPLMFIAKYDSAGTVLWAEAGNGGGSNGQDVCFDRFGNVYLTGTYFDSSITFGSTTLINYGPFDIFTSKLSQTITSLVENPFLINNSLTIAPNPTTTTCTISAPTFSNSMLIVYDLTGRALLQQVFNQGATVNVAQLKAGMYVVEVRDKEGRRGMGKVVRE